MYHFKQFLCSSNRLFSFSNKIISHLLAAYQAVNTSFSTFSQLMITVPISLRKTEVIKCKTLIFPTLNLLTNGICSFIPFSVLWQCSLVSSCSKIAALHLCSRSKDCFSYSDIDTCLVSLSLLHYQTHLLHWVILISKTHDHYFQSLISHAPFQCSMFYFTVDLLQTFVYTFSFHFFTYDTFPSPLQLGFTLPIHWIYSS